MGLDENIDHVTILVDSPSKIPSLILDSHEQFIHVPRIAQATLSSPEFPSVFNTKLPTPLADGLAADDDSTLGQAIFYISEAQAEAVVEPDSMADDIRRKSVSTIAGHIGFHSHSLLGSSQLDNTRSQVVIWRTAPSVQLSRFDILPANPATDSCHTTERPCHLNVTAKFTIDNKYLLQYCGNVMRHRVSIAAKMEELGRLCREHGLPLTVQRRAVLEALMQRHDHPTADQIAEDVALCLPGVSRTTVYRVLDTLVRISIARKVCHPGAAARFEVESHRHHHLVCVECGRMIDVEDSRLDKLPFPDSKVHGFKLTDYSIQFRGICAACARDFGAKEERPLRQRRRDSNPSQTGKNS